MTRQITTSITVDQEITVIQLLNFTLYTHINLLFQVIHAHQLGLHFLLSNIKRGTLTVQCQMSMR